MILMTVRVRCDEPGCGRDFAAEMPFPPRAPAHWARSAAPLTEAEFQESREWRLPGQGEMMTAPIYCPAHAPHDEE